MIKMDFFVFAISIRFLSPVVSWQTQVVCQRYLIGLSWPHDSKCNRGHSHYQNRRYRREVEHPSPYRISLPTSITGHLFPSCLIPSLLRPYNPCFFTVTRGFPSQRASNCFKTRMLPPHVSLYLVLHSVVIWFAYFIGFVINCMRANDNTHKS